MNTIKTFKEYLLEVDTVDTIDLNQFTSDDFQNRGNKSPKSSIPVSITAKNETLTFTFHHTDEGTAKKWVLLFCKNNKIEHNTLRSSQQGDYDDDWVDVTVLVQNAKIIPTGSIDLTVEDIQNVLDIDMLSIKERKYNGEVYFEINCLSEIRREYPKYNNIDSSDIPKEDAAMVVDKLIAKFKLKYKNKYIIDKVMKSYFRIWDKNTKAYIHDRV